MKRRSLVLTLSDEQAAVLDAVRFAYGSAGAQEIGDVVRRWLDGAATDPQVSKLLRLRRRRGMRVVA